MNPLRLSLTAELCRAWGLFSHPDVKVSPVRQATDDELATVHTPEFIAAVKAASQVPEHANPRFGLGTEDDPAFPGMHEATALIVGATVEAMLAVWRGEAPHGVNFTGGLHHAATDHVSGFCVYNDIAVGIKRLLDEGAQRIAYVDIDAHHGDGVEAIFRDDPRVLTVSIHETGAVLFPGTGFPRDIGGPQALGSAVNVALPPATHDVEWLRAIESVVAPLLRAFEPEALVTQHGADTHEEDPLAHFSVSVDAQRHAALMLRDLAHECCAGRWVAVGGGGYAITGVVPRTWTHLVAIAAGDPIPVDAQVPETWRERVFADLERLHGAEAAEWARQDQTAVPTAMGDRRNADTIVVPSWAQGYHPESPGDRAIMATREAVFPHHGLDPHFD